MKNKQIVFLILILMWMGVVFWFSHEPSIDSSNTSGNTIRAILSITPSFRQLTEEEKTEVIETIQPVARKLAHLSIYAIGGVVILLYFNEYELKEIKKIFYSILLGLVYSVFDEIHQTFIPGRAGMLIDVIIDTIGVAIGVILIYTLINLIKRKRETL